jgi:hypothetical protein
LFFNEILETRPLIDVVNIDMANDPLLINYEPESNQVNSENRGVIVDCEVGRRSIGQQFNQVVNVDPVSSPFT